MKMFLAAFLLNLARVIANGGTTFSSSARFQLGSTIAQPLAAVPSSSRFSIQGGFWIWPSPIIFAPIKTGNNFIFSFQTEQESVQDSKAGGVCVNREHRSVTRTAA